MEIELKYAVKDEAVIEQILRDPYLERDRKSVV